MVPLIYNLWHKLGIGATDSEVRSRLSNANVLQKQMKTKPTAINYRYTEAKQQQVVRLSERLTALHDGRRVSYTKIIDMALDALEEKLDREDKRKDKGPGE